jgi:hypothetical protein
VKVYETPRSVYAAFGLWVSLRVEHRRTTRHQPSNSLSSYTVTHHLDCMYVVKRIGIDRERVTAA